MKTTILTRLIRNITITATLVGLTVTLVAQVASTKSTSPPGATAGYAPVVERVLAGDGDANKRFLDLDTGKQYAAAEFFGPKDEPSPEETQQWWRKTGIDAVGDTSRRVFGLVGFNMVASPVPSEDWESLPPSRLDYYLKGTQSGTPVTMSGKGELPATFAVKTREGSRGLLQIVSVSASKLSEVKIRYKMVQTAGVGAKPSSRRKAP